MEPACIRHTDLPGTAGYLPISPIILIALRAFIGHNPHDPAALGRGCPRDSIIRMTGAPRWSALRAQNGESASLDRLAQPGTVAVVTGQQVGLFSRTRIHDLQSDDRGAPGARSDRTRHSRRSDFLAGHRRSRFRRSESRLEFSMPRISRIRCTSIRPPNNGRQRPVGNIVLDHPPVDALGCGRWRDFRSAKKWPRPSATPTRPASPWAQRFRALLANLLGKFGSVVSRSAGPGGATNRRAAGRRSAERGARAESAAARTQS